MVELKKNYENDFLNIVKFIASFLIVGSHSLPLFNIIPSFIIFLITQTYVINVFDDSKILRKMADIIYIIHPLVIFIIDRKYTLYYFDRFLMCYLISFVFSWFYIILKEKFDMRK